ncbi:DMT family transporter [Clostridium sp. 'deep sea']|uniref:DMT family transporter n=1 Tax=Clostridium sp. 'deep sea' TaxID=2779445 RepID=UPI00189692C0|nr:DMT family transporter [Clostridium sp. 'deep sea']QOR36680.1 DMT family transporter [Clostridium sp. 'deep sea']
MARKKALIMLIIAAVLWSTGGILIKNINQNAFVIAGTRSGIAACVIFIYLHKQKIKTYPTKNNLVGALLYMLMVVLYVIANKLTSAANAILLQFSAPIWVAILAKYFLNEDIKKQDLVAIILVISGLTIFFIENLSFTQVLGNSLAVLSGVALASVVICFKLTGSDSAITTTFLGNSLTFITCFIFVIKANFSYGDIINLMVLGIFQLGISYVVYSIAVQHVTAVEAILITVIEPILNPIWVFIFSGEKLTLNALMGGTIVVLTIVVRAIYNTKKSNLINNNTYN